MEYKKPLIFQKKQTVVLYTLPKLSGGGGRGVVGEGSVCNRWTRLVDYVQSTDYRQPSGCNAIHFSIGTGPNCERLRSFTKPQYNYIAEELKTSGSKRYRCTISYRSGGKAKSVDSGGYYSTKNGAAEKAARRILLQEKWSLD